MGKRAQPTSPRRRGQAAPKKKAKRRFRLAGSTVLLRWCVVGVLGLVAFLYYRPLASYVETRSALNARAAEVQELRAERARLQARLERSATLGALAREARRNGFVRPGEQLFVVRGIAEWRRAQRAARRDRATLGRDG